jgi:hypothetical protein
MGTHYRTVASAMLLLACGGPPVSDGAPAIDPETEELLRESRQDPAMSDSAHWQAIVGKDRTSETVDLMAGAHARIAERRAAQRSIATSPCDGPRSYRNWSNAEVSAALVRYMDGRNDEILQDLIDEGACRQKEGRGDDPLP